MNLTGVSGAAVTPPVQGPPDPLTRHARDDSAAGAGARAGTGAGTGAGAGIGAGTGIGVGAGASPQAAAAAEQQRAAQQKLPPLKPLSTTEMRVMLGAIPPGHVGAPTFDLYA